MSDDQHVEAIMPDGSFLGVGVVPNGSVVRGQLLSIKPHSSGRGSEWIIAVDEARDVSGLPNFLREYIGKTIPLYVPPELNPGLAAQDILEARVAYRGDERGGLFTIIGNDIRKV